MDKLFAYFCADVSLNKKSFIQQYLMDDAIFFMITFKKELHVGPRKIDHFKVIHIHDQYSLAVIAYNPETGEEIEIGGFPNYKFDDAHEIITAIKKFTELASIKG